MGLATITRRWIHAPLSNRKHRVAINKSMADRQRGWSKVSHVQDPVLSALLMDDWVDTIQLEDDPGPEELGLKCKEVSLHRRQQEIRQQTDAIRCTDAEAGNHRWGSRTAETDPGLWGTTIAARVSNAMIFFLRNFF